MNEYNLSDSAGGQIAGVIPSSLETSQYNLQGLRRYEISLRANRTSGEFLPWVEGEYIFIESCDFPVYMSLVRSDSGHEKIINPGDEYHGPFKGLYLRHLNNSAPASTPVNLVFYCGSGETYSNNAPRPIQMSQGINSPSQVLGANGTHTFTAWLPENSREIYKLSFAVDVTLTAAIAADFTVAGYFRLTNNATPISTVSGVNPYGAGAFNAVGAYFGGKCEVAVIDAATFQYRIYYREERIPLPSFARFCAITLRAGISNNIVSAGTSYTINGSGPFFSLHCI